MIKIDVINTQTDLMSHYEFIKGIPVVNLTPETMLANCLLGVNWAISFVKDDEVVGVAIVRTVSSTELHVVGMHLVAHTKEFYEMFYKKIHSMGFKLMTATSALPRDRFEGFSGFEYNHSYYTKDLNKEF